MYAEVCEMDVAEFGKIRITCCAATQSHELGWLAACCCYCYNRNTLHSKLSSNKFVWCLFAIRGVWSFSKFAFGVFVWYFRVRFVIKIAFKTAV